MKIKTIGVIGSGLMGSGIAQVAASSEFNVLILDVDQARLQKGLASISESLDRLLKKEKITSAQKSETLKRIQITTQVSDFSKADFVIEAATENVPVKLDLFKKCDEVCPKEAILVSNTSSISITRNSGNTSIPAPASIAGLRPCNRPIRIGTCGWTSGSSGWRPG